MYVAFNNGQAVKSVAESWEDIDGNVQHYQLQSGEVSFGLEYPTPEQLASAFPQFTVLENNNNIQIQIAVLEAQQTDRRIREALAGTDGGWLVNLNNQITALRATLTTP